MMMSMLDHIVAQSAELAHANKARREAQLAAQSARNSRDSAITQARKELGALAFELEHQLAEWHKLRDPNALHINLLREQPARLSHDQLLHIIGDKASEWKRDAARWRHAVEYGFPRSFRQIHPAQGPREWHVGEHTLGAPTYETPEAAIDAAMAQRDPP
ncbi:hypothetical protein CXB49_09730 [Chromobacterium sp. ATCC 53434]|nr:hypothetical protein CXB49_09730 [Chromobacterium sp. ATCC 53434]